MKFRDFVKNDFAKLGDCKKVCKAIGIIGGIGIAAINMINDKNDREAMKADITKEVLNNLTKKDQ